MAQPQTKGKYWLAGHSDSEITYDEVKELATISETDFDALSQLAKTATELNQVALQLKIVDVSPAGQVYATIPWDCTLSKVDTVLNGAISGGDAAITVKNNGGSTAGSITVANSGSAAGDKDSVSPSSNNTFSAGDLLEIETDSKYKGEDVDPLLLDEK